MRKIEKIKKDLMDFLIVEQYMRGYDIIPKDASKKSHGSCCYCQDCGHPNDPDCVCTHNFFLENINRIFK